MSRFHRFINTSSNFRIINGNKLTRLVTRFRVTTKIPRNCFQLLRYQNIRGGRTTFQTIAKPPQVNDTINVANAFKIAIEIEKCLNEHFLGLHEIADDTRDAHFSDFLEGNVLLQKHL